jgi:hypothetical protein
MENDEQREGTKRGHLLRSGVLRALFALVGAETLEPPAFAL